MNNNVIVPIPTELKDIKSELMFGLTQRQLFGFAITLLFSLPTFFLFKRIDLQLGMYASFFVGAPIIFITMYQSNKLYLEIWFKNWLEQDILFKEKRLYEINKNNKKVAIDRGFIKE